MSALNKLQDYGQSVWLDSFRRSLVTSGELMALIRDDGLRGITANPSIFEKAIGGSSDYDEAIKKLTRESNPDAGAIYEYLAVEDMQMAAEALRPVYQATEGRDGFISIEVSPYLAMETGSTVAEARRLWREIGRENLMVKVPATPAGLPAIRQLTAEGINVNITLLFSRRVYEEVAEAYLSGLEARLASGANITGIASVASFFVSRIDTAVDRLLEERQPETNEPAKRDAIEALLGKVAIANAKLAYQRYKEIFRGERWDRLAHAGARTQRLLWASTGTKNPRYSDVRYIEDLIGPDTVNTIPPATMDAFRQHGHVRCTLEEGLAQAGETLSDLERLGISLETVTDKLTADGVRLFSDAADKLFGAIERKRRAVLASGFDRDKLALPRGLEDPIDATIEDWRLEGKIRSLWRRDASLWTGANENEWLGWLDVADDRLAHLVDLEALAQEIKDENFADVVLLGMGGSSLGAEVLATTLGSSLGYPSLHVLDSTDPAQIRTIEGCADIAHTLFIVSSKSGTTLEPNIFQQYFFERTARAIGNTHAPKHFIAITDPGSPLEQVAKRDNFRHVFCGVPSIGGRYSVLSNFGMVPAATIGLDVGQLLDTAEAMVHSCAASVPPSENPGVKLGLVLGTLAKGGRDKVTIVASPAISSFGTWLEQLIAESTGKNGRGLIPIDGEPPGPPEVYGADRVFVYLRLDNGADTKQDAMIESLAQAGQPVIRITVADAYHVGQEFFRWEMAVAVAGAVIGINPFDQPDVEASKVKTRELTATFEKAGTLPPEHPIFAEDGIRLFADAENSKALAAAGAGNSLSSYLRAHLGRLREGDYAAFLAYIERNEAHIAPLQASRQAVRDAKHVATCLGFGPRFLHSTGQAYKGGPNSGVFVQITCDDATDIAIPGHKFGFSVVKAAQARGDFDVLAERGRRALRIHLGTNLEAGLTALQLAVSEGLM